MAAETLNAVVERSGIDPAAVEDVILGCVTQAGEQAFAFGRNAVLASRLPETVPAVTIDRQCGSSQQAVQFAAQAVMSGTQDIVIAAGAESMTRVPMFSNIALHQKAGIGADPFSDRIKQRVMVGQLDHHASQQLKRPPGATFGRPRTGSGHKQGFFVAGQLTISACPRLLVQGGFEIAFNEAALGPVNGRAADSHSSGNLFVAEPAVGGQQNLGSFDLAGVMLAAPQQRGEFTPLGFAQFDVVAYVHPGLLANREAQTNESIVWHVSSAPPFTDKQGKYLAFIYAYSRIFRQPPAEADMQRHFQVSPPSVHQMVITLERAGLIRRTPGVARSIEILVEPEDLPVLR
jgi:hypothetical protein